MDQTPAPSRRTVLKGAMVSATVGAATLFLPSRSYDEVAAAAPAAHGIFGYGVASGDPSADTVTIWTRATPPGTPIATPGSGLGEPLDVTWEVARDPQFRAVVAHGGVRTHASSDHTIKVDVTGLSTYTRYWYRFRTLGETSPIGRTQTAPDDPQHLHALRFALVSCSNYTGGYFGAYRGIAGRDDIDFVLHVGDYIYEYGNGKDRYGPPALKGKRDGEPTSQIVDLADYRLRHALHKADPDLQRAHQMHPFITIFDDHEVANNSWRDGSKAHDPRTDGPFSTRKARAYQAYLEWMPIRLPDQRAVPHQGTRFFRRFEFGALADLSVIETRQNRSRQVDVAPYSDGGGGFVPADIDAINTRLADRDRHLPEPEQLAWLQRGVARPRTWHLIGNQVVLTPLRFPARALGHDSDRILVNSDQWDGYRADQAALIDHLAAQPHSAGDTAVLTGDIHSSWAMDIPTRTDPHYTSAGVEFACPSVTSDGIYELFRSKAHHEPVPAVLERTRVSATRIRDANRWVKYLDTVGHGYTIVDVRPDRVQADWYLTPTPTTQRPDPRLHPEVVPDYRASWQTVTQSRRVSAASEPAGPRHDLPRS